jgi:ABC-type Mn2+/Zn2+ transport system ATPase subunit
MEALKDRIASELSGGQRKIVELARALVSKTDLAFIG